MSRTIITEALGTIFRGIAQLEEAFPSRAFTIDGRLVGDIGEVIAELEYDIILDPVSRPGYDCKTVDGRDVQVKATFKDQLTFKTIPDYYLGFKLFPNGEFEEVFNGPSAAICDCYSHRAGFGTKLLSFPISRLKELSRAVRAEERIPRRTDRRS